MSLTNSVKNNVYPFVLIGLILVILFGFGLWEILHLSPQGIHRWRQTDSASIVYHYFAFDFSFFEPQILNQRSNNGASGHAVSEFPGYYYVVASIWKIFGNSNFIYRIISFCLFSVGLLSLLKLIQQIIQTRFWSFIITLSVCGSCITLYYASSFTVDVPAFSFTLLGTFLLFKYQQLKKNSLLMLAWFFIVFAGLTKIVSLIPIIALLSAYFFTTIRTKKIRVFSVFEWILIFIGLGIISSWLAYATHYNLRNKTDFFSTQTFSIWDYSFTEIKSIWNDGFKYWSKELFNFSFLGILLFEIVFIIFHFRKLTTFWKYLFIFNTLGLLSFVSLWYYCFLQHDYYFIHTLFYVIFIQICFFHMLETHFTTFSKRFLLKGLFLIVFLLNVYNATFLLERRYQTGKEGYPIFENTSEIQHYLTKIGVHKNDKIIALGEGTPNYLLYAFGRKGWTEWVYGYGKQLNKDVINRRINLGAKYLIIAYPTQLNEEDLKTYTQNKIGQFKDVRIFKLKN